MDRHQKQLGLSIVEVMVATIILSIIIYTTVVLVNKNQDIHSGLTEEYALYHEVRATMTLLENDISMLMIQKPRFDYQEGTEIYDAVFIGDESKFSAVTTNYRKRLSRERATNIREIEYFIVQDETAEKDEPAFTLMKKTSSFLDEELFGPGPEYAVLTDIKSWSFEYYNEESSRWESNWDSREGIHKNELPKAVSVEFEIYERDPDNPFAKPRVIDFSTKFLADAVIEQSKVFELSKSVKDLQRLIKKAKDLKKGQEGQQGDEESTLFGIRRLYEIS